MGRVIPKGAKVKALMALHLMGGLSLKTRRVAALLIDHANPDTGQCDPSQLRLAALSGCDVRTVGRSIRCLHRMGLVEVGSSHTSARWLRNSYGIQWAKFSAIHDAHERRKRTVRSYATPENYYTAASGMAGDAPPVGVLGDVTGVECVEKCPAIEDNSGHSRVEKCPPKKKRETEKINRKTASPFVSAPALDDFGDSSLKVPTFQALAARLRPPGSNKSGISPEATYYALAADTLGRNSGGAAGKLLQHFGGDIPAATRALSQAARTGVPREYVGGILRAQTRSPALEAGKRTTSF